LKFGSVCSGIEAASVAFEPLGFTAQWFSEIEHFPSEVLKYRYPTVPNLGDMTKLKQNETFRASSIDLLVGGTPCQSFSVAGLRGGLADPRGNLMLTFLSLADAKKPRWIVWENVPGVLSSNGGKDFGTFLGALGELGYGFAYRVLDAQHFGVAQRRRRVFVIGYLGDWRPAAAVLFERESLSRDSKPSRKKGKETSTDAEGCVGEASPYGRETIGTLGQRDYKGIGNDDLESGRGFAIEVKQVAQPIMLDDQGGSVMRVIEDGVCGTLRRETHGHEPLVAQPIPINTMTVMGRPSDELNPRMGIGIGNPNDPCPTLTKAHSHAVAQPILIHDQATRFQGKRGDKQDGKGNGLGIGNEGDVMNTLTKADKHAVAQPIAVENPTIIDRAAFNQGQNAQYEPRIEEGQTMSSLVAKGPHAVQHTMAIRRLTPKECERLQGFQDDWTKIPYRNKPADQCPDGPRYKACGNSMAVPVMRWIGQRIQLINTIIN